MNELTSGRCLFETCTAGSSCNLSFIPEVFAHVSLFQFVPGCEDKCGRIVKCFYLLKYNRCYIKPVCIHVGELTSQIFGQVLKTCYRTGEFYGASRIPPWE